MPLRLAIFGQAPFGRDVTVRLAEAGHDIVYVHVPADKGGRPDPLAEEAESRGWFLVRHKAFRRKGEPIAERVDEYRARGADLNVMPFTTVILPPPIVDAPPKGSICFHPSLLPAYRGGNALAWQIILGAEETGVSVFRPDEGVDTGPLLVQKGGVQIDAADSSASLYFDKLYPMGVEAILEAVEGVAAGTLTARPQAEAGASFQGLVDDEVARVDWSKPAAEVDRLIRGCDPQPGAWAEWKGRAVRLYGAHLTGVTTDEPPGTVLGEAGGPPAAGALRIAAAGGGVVEVAKLRVEGDKKGPAAEAGIAPGERLA